MEPVMLVEAEKSGISQAGAVKAVYRMIWTLQPECCGPGWSLIGEETGKYLASKEPAVNIAKIARERLR